MQTFLNRPLPQNFPVHLQRRKHSRVDPRHLPQSLRSLSSHFSRSHQHLHQVCLVVAQVQLLAALQVRKSVLLVRTHAGTFHRFIRQKTKQTRILRPIQGHHCATLSFPTSTLSQSVFFGRNQADLILLREYVSSILSALFPGIHHQRVPQLHCQNLRISN